MWDYYTFFMGDRVIFNQEDILDKSINLSEMNILRASAYGYVRNRHRKNPLLGWGPAAYFYTIEWFDILGRGLGVSTVPQQVITKCCVHYV